MNSLEYISIDENGEILGSTWMLWELWIKKQNLNNVGLEVSGPIPLCG